jgi:dTDP-glucose pyrophosphorylase
VYWVNHQSLFGASGQIPLAESERLIVFGLSYLVNADLVYFVIRIENILVNIVIPMAGAGSRFAAAGYSDPKPLISVGGCEMIRIVIENLRPSIEHRFIFICQQEHIDNYGLAVKLVSWAPGCHIIGLHGLTRGAACSVLAARELINDEFPLMIANSDQFVDENIDIYLKKMEDVGLDGIVMTMAADDPKWSYVALGQDGLVAQVVEKKVISNEATVGVYNFRHGRDFVAAADKMISLDLRVNGEFYVAPVYTLLIESGLKVGIHNVGSEADGMYGLGTPSDLEIFLKSSALEKATGFL